MRLIFWSLFGLVIAVICFYSVGQIQESIECMRKLEATLAEPMYLRTKTTIDYLFFDDESAANVTINCIDFLAKNLSLSEIENLKTNRYNQSLVMPAFHQACQLEWKRIYIAGMMTPSDCTLKILNETEKALAEAMIKFHETTNYWSHWVQCVGTRCNESCQDEIPDYQARFYCKRSLGIYLRYKRNIKQNY